MSSSAEEAVREVVRAENAIAMLKLEREQILWDHLTAEQKQAHNDVAAEYQTKILGWEAELEAAKANAVTRVLEAGQTCTADGLQAVWVKGRRGAWDDDRITQLVRELADCWLVKSLRMANQDKFADALEAYLGDFANALLNARKPDGSHSVSFKYKKEKANE